MQFQNQLFQSRDSMIDEIVSLFTREGDADELLPEAAAPITRHELVEFVRAGLPSDNMNQLNEIVDSSWAELECRGFPLNE